MALKFHIEVIEMRLLYQKAFILFKKFIYDNEYNKKNDQHSFLEQNIILKF